MMGILLARCVHETDSETRSLLGACLGEVGAIDEHRLGVISMSDVLGASDSLDSQDSNWRLSQPPWRSQSTRYELQLITRHLVFALKAAQSMGDQHKIALTIQQILQLLDSSAQERRPATNSNDSEPSHRPEMSRWLKDQLVHAGVIDSVEPFWNSEFAVRVSYSLQTPYQEESTDSNIILCGCTERRLCEKSSVFSGFKHILLLGFFMVPVHGEAITAKR